MSSKVAVVIPTYKEELSPLEKISLEQCRKILGKYPLIFIAPEGKNFSYFAPNDGIAYFPPQFFQSVKTYSRLLMSPDFYETFADFEYILIYQLDAFVFYDALEDFCQLGWDYIGASWYFSWGDLYRGKTLRVGNGGFSLRKVAACHKLLLKKNLPNLNLLEDAFFAVCGASDELNFHVAPVKVADLFSMEHYPERNVRRLGYELPFGCHGWTKLSSDFYVNIFAQLGYDLRPFRAQMRSEDYEFFLPQSLVLLAMRRLIREINHGKKNSSTSADEKFCLRACPAIARSNENFVAAYLGGKFSCRQNFYLRHDE